MASLDVLICGGGIAGIEGLLRLRRLAGERVELTIVSPEEEFVCRPLAVREPFGLASVRRYPMERIASDTGARWIRDRLVRVDVEACAVHTAGGRELSYDALLVALGARESAPYEHAHVFTDRDPDQSFQGIVRDIELGHARSVAFVLPHGSVWPVPLYELALMTADRARSLSLDAQITFITPEGRPLKAFRPSSGRRDRPAGRRGRDQTPHRRGGPSTSATRGDLRRGADGVRADRDAAQDHRSGGTGTLGGNRLVCAGR